MIIQALKEYYEILKDTEGIDIPLHDYALAKVSHALVLSKQGELKGVISLLSEEKQGKKSKIMPKSMIVPERVVRSSNITPNFMSDKPMYVLGIDDEGNITQHSKKAFMSFREFHKKLLADSKSEAAKAVVNFLESWNPDKAKEEEKLKELFAEIGMTKDLVFMLDEELTFLHDNIEIKKVWEKYNDSDSVQKEKGQCLVCGETKNISRLHLPIKNIKDAQSSGAPLISFNNSSYESYCKQQSYNSPVSKEAMFAYTTVLNYMLNKEKQKFYIGDATVVFWAESPEGIYVDLASELFNPSHIAKPGDNSEARKKDVKVEKIIKDVFENIRQGIPVSSSINEYINPKTKFYILGISPNKSRLSVRFFYKDSFGSFIEKICQHYSDMQISKEYKNQPDNISIWMVQNETVSPKSSEKKPSPLLAGSFMRSIINGGPYPFSLYNSILQRIRTDMDDNDKNIKRVNYVRAAVIKAYLQRYARIYNKKHLKEVLNVGLNEQTNNIAYLLGRLFAILEKAQQDSNPDMNRTIKDRYFTSACTTPASVFPILLKLVQHHIAKLEYGVAYEKQIGSIMDKIIQFPPRLTLEEQGVFIIGYYHQRVEMFKNRS